MKRGCCQNTEKGWKMEMRWNEGEEWASVLWWDKCSDSVSWMNDERKQDGNRTRSRAGPSTTYV